MTDLSFTTNTFNWSGTEVSPATQQAVQFAKSKQQKALESINYFNEGQLSVDDMIRLHMPTVVGTPVEGDIWWSGTQGYRYSALHGLAARTNIFPTQDPVLSLAKFVVQAGVAEASPDIELEDRPAVRFTCNTTSAQFQAGITNDYAAGTYTVSFSVVSTETSNLRSFNLHFGTQTVPFVLDSATSPKRVSITATVELGTHTTYITPVEGEEVLAGDVVYIAAVMIEPGSVAGSFFDGNSAGGTWTGAIGNSTSQYDPGWVDEDTRVKYIVDIITDPDVVDGYVDIYSGPEMPPAPTLGDLWEDDAYNLYRWDGTWFKLVDSGDPAITEYLNDSAAAMADVLDAISGVEAQLDGVVNIFYQSTVPDPLGVGLGDIWIDISIGKVMKRWDGDSWELIDDERILQALEEVQGKITSYYDVAEPTAPPEGFSVGDLWFETDQNNKPHRWDGTDWVDIADPRVDEHDTSIGVIEGEIVSLGGSVADLDDILNTAFPQGPLDVNAAVAAAIKSWVSEYAVSSSETVAPTSGWSTATPTRTPGTFIWYRVVVTYGDNTTSTTSPALLTGNTGADGEDGSQGIPGPPGEDGTSLYTWLKYANSTTPLPGEMFDSPTGMSYIGLAYNKVSATESTVYTDYQWSLIKGADGADGDPGVQGPPGADGVTTYTWVKYSNSSNGIPMQDSHVGMTYIGFAFNKTTATESTTPGDYQWSLIQGPQGNQGIPGEPGTDGITYYTWLKYASSSTPAPADMSDSPTGKTYMGIAVGKTSPTETTVYTDYNWSLIQGPQGNQGIPGEPGVDGTTTYTWVKYAPNGTPSDGQITDTPVTGTTHIGLAFNKTTATESPSAAQYQWSLIQGPQGPQGNQGIPGTPGDDGITYYTWLKYASSATPAPADMSDSPVGKTYLGLAYNKLSQTETTVYTDYTWSLIKGDQGDPGIPGTPGDDGITYYTWVKYAPNADGTGLQDSNVGMTYIGLAFNKTTSVESLIKTDYAWSKIVGDPGTPGTPGVGIVSVTPYFRLGTTVPAKPTTNPPPSPWQTTEPAWVEGQMMYRTELIVYTSGSPGFAYTDVSTVAAFQAADAAMQAANGKNVVTYTGIGSWSSLPALPTTTGRITGDIHRVRYTDTGEIAAEYTIVNGAWIRLKYGDAILTSLDVGKLSAGTATIQTSVIEFLWTKVVNAKKITAEMLLIQGENLIADPSFLDTAVGGLVEQRCTYSTGGWTRVTTGPLHWLWSPNQALSSTVTIGAHLANGIGGAAHSPVTGGQHYRIKCDVIHGSGVDSAVAYPKIWYNTATGEVDVQGTLVDPTPVAVDNQGVTAEWEWVAPIGAVGVRMSMFFDVTSGPVVGGSVAVSSPGVFAMADGSLVVEGSVQAGEVKTGVPGGPLVHVVNGAINVYGPERAVEDGTVRDVWLNLGADLTATGDIGDLIGDNLWRVPDMNDPDVSSSSINKQGDSEFLTVSARDDMFIGGESVKEALAEAVQPALLIVDSRWQQAARGPYSVYTGIWRWSAPAIGGHRYGIHFGFNLVTNATWFNVQLMKTEATPPAVPVQPSVGTTVMYRRRFTHAPGTNSRYYFVDLPFNPSLTENTSWLLGIETVSNASNPWTISEYHIKMVDYGAGPDNTGYATTGGAAETPPTAWMDKYFYFTKHRTWSQNGRNTQYSPWWVRTGRGGSSLYRGYLQLSSTDRAKIMSSEVAPSSIKLELDVASGYGGYPRVGIMTGTDVDSATEPAKTSIYKSSASAPASAGSVTFTLNSTQINSLYNGGWGIYLGPEEETTYERIIDFKGTNTPVSPSGAYSTTVVPRLKIRGKWAS